MIVDCCDKSNLCSRRHLFIVLMALVLTVFVLPSSVQAQVVQEDDQPSETAVDTGKVESPAEMPNETSVEMPTAEAGEPAEDVNEPAEVVNEPADDTAAEPVEEAINEPMEATPAPVLPVDKNGDVMRPTRHGFRLSPKLAELGARMWVRNEMGQWVDLSERQEAELGQRIARRVMTIAHEHSEQGREFIEFMLERQLANQFRMGSMSLADKQEFGERMTQWLPVLRDLLKEVARDTRPLLNREQWNQAREGLANGFKDLNRLEEKMRRWAEGGALEDEDIADDLQRWRKPGPQAGERDEESTSTSVELRRARRRAQTDLRRLERGDWRDFLDHASEYFHFDEQQRVRGWELVTEFRKQAAEIMTPEWCHRLRENRIKYYLRWNLEGFNGQRMTPWVYRIEREYNEFMAELEVLKAKFKQGVINIAEDDQRKKAAVALVERAKQHGMELDDRDIKILELTND